MRQYSIDTVEAAWLGLDFKEGLAQGASITEAKTTSPWSIVPTGQGKVTRVYNPDRSGTLSVVVDQTSQLHQSLKGIAEADRLPATRNQVATFKITDTASGEVFDFLNAFILTDPDMIRGTEASTFTWVFGFEKRESPEVTTLTNLVGT